MKRKQCKNGDHLKPGDLYLENLDTKEILCSKCLHKKGGIIPQIVKHRWGFYKRTVFHK